MPIDIVSLIRQEVSFLDIGSGVAPQFGRGEKFFQNFIADKIDSQNGVVFLTKPLVHTGKIELSGAYTQDWDLSVLFAIKVRSQDMFNEDLQEEAVTTATKLQIQFKDRLNGLMSGRIVVGYNSFDVRGFTNLFDKGISGVYFRFHLITQSGEAVCIVPTFGAPVVTITPASLTLDPGITPLYTLTGGSPSGGVYLVDGVPMTQIDTTTFGAGSYDVLYVYTDPDTGMQGQAWQTITILSAVAPVTICTNPAATNYGLEGECVFATSTVNFQTGAAQAVQTKIGADLIETDIAKIPSLQSAAVALQLQVLYWFTLHSDPNLMDNALALKVNNLATAMGTDKIVFYPVSKITTPPFTKLYWLISVLDPVAVALDAESQVSDATPYKTKTAAAIGFINGIDSSIKKILDDALVYRTNATSLNWNTQLAPVTGTPIGRQYIQLSDQISFTTDMASNLVKYNSYRNTTFFTDLTNFLSRLPNQTKKAITQWHTEDTGASFVSDKPLGNYIIGDTIRLILSNTNHFEYLIWMTLGNLIKNGVPEPEYNSIKRFVPAFKFANVMPVTIPFAGCDALGFSNGANSFGLLIVNQRSVEHTILASDIGITGKTVSGNFTRDSGFAATWDAAQQNEVVSEAAITVKKNSANWITFTTV